MSLMSPFTVFVRFGFRWVFSFYRCAIFSCFRYPFAVHRFLHSFLHSFIRSFRSFVGPSPPTTTHAIWQTFVVCGCCVLGEGVEGFFLLSLCPAVWQLLNAVLCMCQCVRMCVCRREPEGHDGHHDQSMHTRFFRFFL